MNRVTITRNPHNLKDENGRTKYFIPRWAEVVVVFYKDGMPPRLCDPREFLSAQGSPQGALEGYVDFIQQPLNERFNHNNQLIEVVTNRVHGKVHLVEYVKTPVVDNCGGCVTKFRELEDNLGMGKRKWYDVMVYLDENSSLNLYSEQDFQLCMDKARIASRIDELTEKYNQS